MFDSSKWSVLEQDDQLVKILSESLNVSKTCARILINRGYNDAESAKSFMEKTDNFFHNPFLMKDMDKAVSIIQQAIKEDENITIYGDYDVDGVTSVSILYLYLKEHGANVDYYIPTRDSEGYGLNTSAFDVIKSHGTNLIITVDTGITAIDEVEYAHSIGLKVLVTDHHQCRPELPNAEAVVNPKRPDCEYPFKELSGVGVVFKIVCALELSEINGGEYNVYTIRDVCKRFIDLVTIGTVADVMPLVGENRVIVYLGLQLLQNPQCIGIKSLFRAAGIIGAGGQKKVTATTIGYTIAPKINAVGRISSAERAVELFLSRSYSESDVIAEELCAINRERQETENVIYKEAFEQLSKEPDVEKFNAIVLASETWHHGVIGIVASRITEKFGVPSVLISFDGAEPDEEGKIIGKGSVRSIKGVNIVEALSACSDLLTKFGGHALAAGLSIEKKNVPEFRKRLNEYIGNVMKDMDCTPRLVIDGVIDAVDITEQTAESVALLEPYGAGNPIPVFLLRDCEITDIAALSAGKHTRMTLAKDGCSIYSVFFGTNLVEEGYMVGDKIDVVYNIDINEFRGNRNVQLILKDVDRTNSDKVRLSDYAQKAKTDSLKIEKFTRNEVPTRYDFEILYRQITSISSEYVNIRALAKSLPEYSVQKLLMMLKVFQEAGIMDVVEDKKRILVYKVVVLKTKEKVDLFRTPTMQRFFNR